MTDLAPSSVPCGGCTACCRGDRIPLRPDKGDRLEDYRVDITPDPRTGQMQVTLAHGEDGNCVYLGPQGCTIHERAPWICRVFDCRAYIACFGDRAAQRRAVREGRLRKSVYEAAKARPLDP